MNLHRLISVFIFVTYGFGTSFLLAEDATDSLIVFKDDEIYRALPKKHLFRDIDSALFRSGDGKELHLGPGEEGVFFVLSTNGNVKVLTAPSEGKAYLDQTGSFSIWYDNLSEGISFKNGEKLSIEDPTRTRFGVSYGAEFFYLTQTNTTQVFSIEAPLTPLITIPAFYTYKLVCDGDELHLAGYGYLGHEDMRTHQYRRYLKVEDDYILLTQFELADHLVMLDLNPYEKTALFLNDAEMVPQLFKMSLHDEVTKSLGMVQYYGFFLHPGFRNVMPSSNLPHDRR